MNEPVGETAWSLTNSPKSQSLPSTQQGNQQGDNQSESSNVTQPDAATHRPKSSPSLTEQRIGSLQSHHEGTLWGSTSTPDRSDTHRVTSMSSRQATVESAAPSPLMTPIGPEENQLVTLADEFTTPLMTPVGTPGCLRPITPNEFGSTPWKTPRETLEEEQPMSAEGEWSLDFRAVPVLEVVTAPDINQQKQYGGPITSMGRWWWPGYPTVTSSSFLKRQNTRRMD